MVEGDTPPFHWYGAQLDFDLCNLERFIMAVWFCACASVNLALQGVATTQICWQTVGTWDDFCLKWMKLSSRRFAQGQDITALLQKTYTYVDLMLTHTFGLICCCLARIVWGKKWLTIHDWHSFWQIIILFSSSLKCWHLFQTKAFTNPLYKPTFECCIEQKVFREFIFYSIL